MARKVRVAGGGTVFPLAGLGAAAASQVADGRDAPGMHAHPCTLVVGATTAGNQPRI